MKTLNVMLSNLGGRVVPIGYEGENLYTRIRINCIEVFSEYPDATVSMVVSPPDGEMYPAVVEKSGVMVIWDITDSVLSSNGSGECQLTFTEGDVVRKSVVFGISINRSLVASGEAPEPVQEWIDKADQTAQEIAENAANLAKEDIVESYGSIAPAIIETASGAIASFSDGADGMLVKTLTVDIDPVQDLHGYDHPWPAGGGKNLLNPTGTSGTDASVTYTKGTDGKWTSSGTASGTSTILAGEFDVKAGVGYTLNGCPSGGGSAAYRIDVRTAPSSIYNDWIDTGSGMTFTPSEDVHLYVYIRAASGTNMSGKTFSPMIRLSSVSDDTFAPYENECPISGWESANVCGMGKNLSLIESAEARQSAYDLFYDNDNPLPVGNYVVSFEFDNASYTNATAALFDFYDAGNVNFAYPTVSSIKRVSDNAPASTLSQPLNGRFYYAVSSHSIKRIKLYLQTGSYGKWTGSLKNIQLEYGSNASGYEVPNRENVEYEFPETAGTVYGGILTIHQDGSGELVVDRAYKEITKNDSFEISIENQFNRINCLFYQSAGKINGTFVSNTCATIPNMSGGVGSAPWQIYGSTSTIASRCWISVPKTISSVDDFKAFLETNQISIVYELATPVTYQLTNQQVIALLKGSNNIWADTGDVAVEYPADTKLYIDGKVAELQALILENISNS